MKKFNIITFKRENGIKRYLEEFESLFQSYVLNGQIIPDTAHEFHFSETEVKYFVKPLNQFALNSKFNNQYINKRLESLIRKDITITVESENIDLFVANQIRSNSTIILSPLSIFNSSPIKILKNKSLIDFPLFLLPKTHDNSYWDIITWCKAYNTFFDMYFTGYIDEYSYSNLIDIELPLL